MISFAYEAVDLSGKRCSGYVLARSREEALAKLARQKLQPLRLEKGKGPTAEKRNTDRAIAAEVPEPAKGSLRLCPADIIYFTEELSDLLEAGLQLDPALRIMEQRVTKSTLTAVIQRIRKQICDGVRFSAALQNVSSSFGNLYCSMVMAGEASGALAQILRRQVGYLVMMQDLRNRVVQALIYPSFIFGAGLVLLFIFMTMLVPQLSVLFDKTGRGLPLPTRLLIEMSELIFAYWWLILGVVVSGGIGFWRFVSTSRGRFWWHRTQLKIPLIGEILKCRFYAQFAHTMANFIANGLPLLSGLTLLASAIPNVFLKERLRCIAARVGDGGALSRAMAKFGPFSDIFIDLVAVGEQTGDLATAFTKIGSRYDKLLGVRIQRLTAFVQPVIIIMMAMVVGIVAYSILAGIFQSVSGLRAR